MKGGAKWESGCKSYKFIGILLFSWSLPNSFLSFSVSISLYISIYQSRSLSERKRKSLGLFVLFFQSSLLRSPLERELVISIHLWIVFVFRFLIFFVKRERERRNMFEDHQGMAAAAAAATTQMGFLPFSIAATAAPNLSFTNNNNNSSSSLDCHQSLKNFSIPPSLSSHHHHNNNLSETLLSPTSPHATDHFGGPQLLSLQRSSANLW